MTQLSFDELMTDSPVFKREHYANVEKITIPFEWERVDYLMSLESVDFPDYGPHAMASEGNRQHKRNDWQYEGILESLAEDGFLDPIFVHLPGARLARNNKHAVLGNGHHRLVAAYDLGYTHVPVTHDPDEQWRRSDRP